MKKKIVSAFLFMCVLFITTLVYADSDYSITQYNIKATVKSNGDLHVEEYLVYDFSEDRNGLLRDFLYSYTFKGQKDDMNPTSSRYQAGDITNLKVSTADVAGEKNLKKSYQVSTAHNGQSGVHTVTNINTDGKQGYSVKVYSPVKEGRKKYVVYEYDIQDACVGYSDAGEFYYNFIGGDWQCYINKANISIEFEMPIDLNEVKLYPHTYAKELLPVTINEETGTIDFSVKGIDSGIAVDARVVFPKEALSDVNKSYDEKLDQEALAKIEEKMQKDRQKQQWVGSIYIGIGIVAITFLIVLTIMAKRKVKGRMVNYKKADYYRDIPNTMSLEEYNTILKDKLGYSDTNLLMATILDLVNRKVLTMDARKKEKKKAFDKIDYNYYLTFNENTAIEKLAPYDILVLNLLFLAKVKETITVGDLVNKEIELNEALKKFGKSETNKTKLARLQMQYAKDADKHFYTDIEKGIRTIFNIGTVIFIILFLFTFFVISPLNFSVKGWQLILAVMLFVFYGTIGGGFIYAILHTVKEEYLEEYKHLVGLKRYLTEYSLIKEKYPIEITLWDQYLVFACLFGIADKVSKEMQEELVKQGYDDSYIYTTYPIICMSHYSTNMSSYISSNTGVSSGGYSGGGSGGGGGGGRWRWRLLTPKLQN